MTGLTFGHLPNATVCDALAHVRNLLHDVSGAVIRCLDSTDTESELIRILSLHKIGYQVSFENVCVNMEQLWKAVDADVFTGFDEVWIYREEWPGVSLGSAPGVTSDGVDFSNGIPAGLADAIEGTRCLLVVGD